ncbi:hypothetical protein PSCLAVI8L_340008 [Pseudoclavibacter sp. 8L]|nr:hypothetical protein PSCLAVI8L_340008 [Pseudoclavibacter sp. 8L]
MARPSDPPAPVTIATGFSPVSVMVPPAEARCCLLNLHALLLAPSNLRDNSAGHHPLRAIRLESSRKLAAARRAPMGASAG